MKVLLVQSGERRGFGLSSMALVEPLGLEMIAAGISRHEVRLLDLRIEGGLEQTLTRFRPNICGISCSFTMDLYRTLHVASIVKTVDGKKPFVVVGGHYASLSPGDFRDPAVDAVVVGEGEKTMGELVECLALGGDVRSVKGLALNSSQGQKRTGIRPFAQNMDGLPLPARGLTRRYRKQYYLLNEYPAAMVETARGCAYRCRFCSVWCFYRGSVRTKSPERVVEEIETIREPYIFFSDDNFLVHPERAQQIAVLLRRRNLRHKYTFQARSDSIAAHPEVIRLWHRLGLIGVLAGVEKIDNTELSKIRKENTVANNERAMEILRVEHVAVIASFIVDPDWTAADFNRLRRYVITHQVAPFFSVLTPLPGTVLFRQVRDRITSWNYELYDFVHAVLPTRLPLSEFYSHLARLYKSGYSRLRLLSSGVSIIWHALSRGRISHLLYLLKGARMMARPHSYLPGQAHGAITHRV